MQSSPSISKINSEHNKIYSLQALRAFAAIFVMFFHGTTIIYKETGYTYLHNIFMVGFMGVDIFFVLSGFIIFYTYTSNKLNFADFLKKRFVRVFPIYWLVIIGLIIIHVIYPAPDQAEKNKTEVIIASFTLYPSGLYILGVAWTLTYEILFYLIFALTCSINIRYFYYTFFAWSIIIVTTYLLHIKSSVYAINSLIDPVILNFGFGCITAYLFKTYQTFKYWKWVVAAGVVLLIITWLMYYFVVSKDATAWAFTSLMSRVYLFGIPAAILIFGLLYFNRPVPKLLADIGDASYSLYLIHGAVITFILRFFLKTHILKIHSGINIFIVTTLMFVLTVTISRAFYKYIERPLIKQLNKAIK
jgi:exopolysaccharide production protein ExoZ